MEKNSKNEEEKETEKLLFWRNNERLIRRQQQPVIHKNTQQYVLAPATDHCNLFNSFDLNYSIVVSCLLEWSQEQKMVL